MAGLRQGEFGKCEGGEAGDGDEGLDGGVGEEV